MTLNNKDPAAHDSTIEDELASRTFAAFSYLTILHLVGRHAELAARTSPGFWFFVWVMAESALFLVMLMILRKKSEVNFSVLRDLQEIALFGMGLQIFLFCAYHKILPVSVLDFAWAFNSFLASVCVCRLLWPCMNKQGTAFSNWPVFGVLGMMAWWKTRRLGKVKAIPFQHRFLAYLLIMGSVGIGWLAQHYRYKVEDTGFCIAILLMIAHKGAPFWSGVKQRNYLLKQKVLSQSDQIEAMQRNALEAERRHQAREELLSKEIEVLRSQNLRTDDIRFLTESEKEMLAAKQKIPVNFMLDFVQLVKNLGSTFIKTSPTAEVIPFPSKAEVTKPEKP